MLYLYPLELGVGDCPHKSAWIKCKGAGILIQGRWKSKFCQDNMQYKRVN